MKAMLLLLLFPALLYGQATTLETLQTSYDVSMAELGLPMEEWHQKYLAQLDQLQSRAQAAGDLDQIIVIKALIEGGKPQIPAQYSQLKRVQGIYLTRSKQLEQAILQKKRQIMAGYRQKLIALQTDLTKSGAIDQALSVKEIIAGVENEMRSASASVIRPGRPIRATGLNNQPGQLVIEGSKDHAEQGDMVLPPSTEGKDFVRVFAYANNFIAIDQEGKPHTRADAASDHRMPQSLDKPVMSVAMGHHISALLLNDGTLSTSTNQAHRDIIPELKGIVKIAGGRNVFAALLRSGEVVPYGWNLRDKEFQGGDHLKNVVDVAVASTWIIVRKRSGEVIGLQADGSTWDNVPTGLENVVQMAAGSDPTCLFLTREGKVISWKGPPPPSDLGPVKQVRSGSRMFAAQRPDNTWVVWGHEAIAKQMNAKLERLGPLKDLDLGYRFFIGIK